MGNRSRYNGVQAGVLTYPYEEDVLRIYSAAKLVYHYLVKDFCFIVNAELYATESGHLLSGVWMSRSAEEAWKTAWENIQKEMIDKLES